MLPSLKLTKLEGLLGISISMPQDLDSGRFDRQSPTSYVGEDHEMPGILRGIMYFLASEMIPLLGTSNR